MSKVLVRQIFFSAVLGIFSVGIFTGCSPLAGSKSRVGSTQEQDSQKLKDPGENSRSCDYEFTKVGLCGELARVSDHPVQDPASEIYFQIRFWVPGDGRSAGPYINPGLDAVLLPRKCAGCRSSFRASLEENQSASEGAVFRVIPRFTSGGEYNMVIELQKDGQVMDQASVKMKILVTQ
jgi:hypothetical protein